MCTDAWRIFAAVISGGYVQIVVTAYILHLLHLVSSFLYSARKLPWRHSVYGLREKAPQRDPPLKRPPLSLHLYCFHRLRDKKLLRPSSEQLPFSRPRQRDSEARCYRKNDCGIGTCVILSDFTILFLISATKDLRATKVNNLDIKSITDINSIVFTRSRSESD